MSEKQRILKTKVNYYCTTGNYT